MSKKVAILIQTALLFVTLGKAYAQNMTVDVYEYGRHAGTMTIPANQYQNVANRMRGTGVNVRPQPRPDAAERQQAAERKMAEWQRQAELRRKAALAQQERWNQDFARRHAAAQRGFKAWQAAR